LLAYTCDAALASKRVTRVVLSTDDGEIASVGRGCGVEVPFLRPRELATDDTTSFAVVEHCLNWLADKENFEPEVVVLLQPTSPLRGPHHIDQALERLEEMEADTIVSVIDVPHRFSPYSVMKQEDGWLRDFWEAPSSFDRYRRQSVPTLYARNGPAILATRTQVLKERRSFYGTRVAPFPMTAAESIDIDEQFDLDFAEWLLARRGAFSRSDASAF
jgi:CMP-N-acetylneuraminic acid synthetase